jgi:hypothetical protein
MNSHKVLIRSADRIRGDTRSYTIALPVPIHKVVYAEWTYTSITNVLVSISPLGSTGLATSSANSPPQPYWRFFGALRNMAIVPFPRQTQSFPSSLYDLTITLTPLKNFYVQEHFFEIEFFTTD